MTKLLSFGASILLTASFLDALFTTGLGRPLPWIRDGIMAVLGIVCYVILFRNRSASSKRSDFHI